MSKIKFVSIIGTVILIMSLGLFFTNTNAAKAETDNTNVQNMDSSSVNTDDSIGLNTQSQFRLGGLSMGFGHRLGYGYGTCGCNNYEPCRCNTCRIPCGTNLDHDNVRNIFDRVTGFIGNDITRNVLNNIIGSTCTTCPMPCL